jgi:hypothetical protein
MKRRTALIVSVVLALSGVSGVVGWRRWYSRAPYGPGALHAQATLQLVNQAAADAALRPVNTEIAGSGDQIFLGRVAWTQPPRPRKVNSFRIVLLDKRTHLMPGFIAVTSARPDDVGTGADGSLNVAQKRYPWLQGIGAPEINGSYWSSGSAIFVSTLGASPVTFQTVLHPAHPETPLENAGPTAPATAADLMIALICVGPESQVYWAQRLLN